MRNLLFLSIAVMLGATPSAPGTADLSVPAGADRSAAKAADLPAAVTAQAGRQTCFGQRATLVGTRGHDVIVGTPRRDVIVARAGNDVVRSRGGADRICGGPGDDRLVTNAMEAPRRSRRPGGPTRSFPMATASGSTGDA